MLDIKAVLTMENDWGEIARLTPFPSGPNTSPSNICAFAFDTLQELLWAGNLRVSEKRYCGKYLSHALLGHDHFFPWP